MAIASFGDQTHIQLASSAAQGPRKKFESLEKQGMASNFDMENSKLKFRILCGFAVFSFVVAMTPAQSNLTSSGKCGKPDNPQSIAAGDQIGHLFTLLPSSRIFLTPAWVAQRAKRLCFLSTEKFQKPTVKCRASTWKRLTVVPRFSTPTKPLGRREIAHFR